MRLRARHPRTGIPDHEDQLIPLINIVFLLLIFFMLAGALESPHPVEVDPPRAEVESDKPQTDRTIYIEADGALTVGSEGVALTDLADTVAGRGGDWVVRADAEAGARRVVAVLRALEEGGLERVRLITREGASR
ncbi:MAG: ExbD/TolR family protein [Pseudomonadota bacterium]